MAKELVPIVIRCAIWGPLLVRESVLFQCNNTEVVAAVSKGSAKEPVVMHLLRSMWFFVAHFDISISISIEHISGVCNGVADMLSRDKIQRFFLLNPQANLCSTPIPEELPKIVLVFKPDWTFTTLNQLFNTIINRA